jgi:DNA repair exonuclease SbcCD ATPase subunit
MSNSPSTTGTNGGTPPSSPTKPDIPNLSINTQINKYAVSTGLAGGVIAAIAIGYYFWKNPRPQRKSTDKTAKTSKTENVSTLNELDTLEEADDELVDSYTKLLIGEEDDVETKVPVKRRRKYVSSVIFFEPSQEIIVTPPANRRYKTQRIKVQDLVSDVRAKAKELHNLDSELKRKTEEIENLRGEVDDHEKRLDKIDGLRKMAESERDLMQAQLTKLHTAEAQFIRERDVLQQQIRQHKQELELLHASKSDDSHKIQTLLSEIRLEQEKAKSEARRLRETNKSLMQKNSQRAETQRTIDAPARRVKISDCKYKFVAFFNHTQSFKPYKKS